MSMFLASEGRLNRAANNKEHSGVLFTEDNYKEFIQESPRSVTSLSKLLLLDSNIARLTMAFSHDTSVYLARGIEVLATEGSNIPSKPLTTTRSLVDIVEAQRVLTSTSLFEMETC